MKYFYTHTYIYCCWVRRLLILGVVILFPLHFIAQTSNDEDCGTEISGKPDPVGVYSYSDDPKDYDEITVSITQHHIESLIPNPVNSQLTVTYDAQGATSAYLMLVNQTTSNSDNYILDTEESSIDIDVSELPTGLYSVILVCNGEIQSVKNLVKQ